MIFEDLILSKSPLTSGTLIEHIEAMSLGEITINSEIVTLVEEGEVSIVAVNDIILLKDDLDTVTIISEAIQIIEEDNDAVH